MKRRTNLFYSSGNDAKFLTFSNYTECITGTFLSTNTKLFPSTFICLNIPSISTDNSKEAFIKRLVAYYENKLAFLRDESNNDEQLQPLAYLLRFLKSEGITNIPYIGNITEQSYNGTFADTICVIDTNTIYSGTIVTPELEGNVYPYIGTKLYGWYNRTTDDNNQPQQVYNGPEGYDLTPVTDGEGYYISDNSRIEYTEGTTDTITFNVVIPMFTMVNPDDTRDIVNIYSDGEEPNIVESSCYINVPFGIWFATKPIELTKDDNYGQVWSLAIGSQFKPFPTSPQLESEITQDSNTAAFNTFAQILARQNKVLAMFESLSNDMRVIKSRLSALESATQINTVNN